MVEQRAVAVLERRLALVKDVTSEVDESKRLYAAATELAKTKAAMETVSAQQTSQRVRMQEQEAESIRRVTAANEMAAAMLRAKEDALAAAMAAAVEKAEKEKQVSYGRMYAFVAGVFVVAAWWFSSLFGLLLLMLLSLCRW